MRIGRADIELSEDEARYGRFSDLFVSNNRNGSFRRYGKARKYGEFVESDYAGFDRFGSKLPLDSISGQEGRSKFPPTREFSKIGGSAAELKRWTSSYKWIAPVAKILKRTKLAKWVPLLGLAWFILSKININSDADRP